MHFFSAHAALVRLASRLPKGSPAHRSVVAQFTDLKQQFNLFTRLSILLGATGAPFAEVAQAGREGTHGLKNRLIRLQAETPGLDPEWFEGDMLSPDFYKALLGAATKRLRDTDAAQSLVSDATVGATDASGNLAYQLGKSRKVEGLSTPLAAANSLAKNISIRGIDVLRRNKVREQDTPFDSPTETDDRGRGFAESYVPATYLEDYFLNLFHSPGGRTILRLLDREFNPGGPAQQIVWEAIKEDPALLTSNMDLARAYEERMGKAISPQRAGQLKQSVLDGARTVTETNPEIRWQMSVLNEASRLNIRRSAKKQRLAAVMQEADRAIAQHTRAKRASPEDTVWDVLDNLEAIDALMRDTVDMLDARMGGEPSVSAVYGSASKISDMLRSMSKPLARGAAALAQQARGGGLSRRATQGVRAKFPRGEKMTVDEVADVVGPEFKEMNENPPESVLSVRERMEKQGKTAARLRPQNGMRVQAQGVTGKGLRDGVIYTLQQSPPIYRGGQDTYTFLLRGKPVARFPEETVSMWLETGSEGDMNGLVIL